MFELSIQHSKSNDGYYALGERISITPTLDFIVRRKIERNEHYSIFAGELVFLNQPDETKES